MTQLNDCPAASDGSAAFFDLTPPPFDTSLPTAKALNANSSGCCQAGWMAGVSFQKICEGQAGWFWWYPNAGPVSEPTCLRCAGLPSLTTRTSHQYLCCKKEAE